MPRILAVEDDKDFRELLDQLFSGRGFDVIACASAEDASAYLRDPAKPLPDVILSDVMMPGTDGFAFVNSLQAEERTRTIPVVVLTAKIGTEELFAQSKRVAAVLRKPVDVSRLFATVRAALERAR